MRKSVSLILVLVLCCAMAVPALAADFVPSITYKPDPDVEGNIRFVDEDGDTIRILDGTCLEITPVSEARNTPESQRSESDKLLLEVYDALKDGSMKLPQSDLVIRDLVDASLVCGGYHTDPNHVEELAKPDVYIEITFDLGVGKHTDVIIYAYVDGKWVEADSVKNNGDGTFTVVFNQICPIAFCVEDSIFDVPARTGDIIGQYLWVWIVLLVLSVTGIVALVIWKGRKK